jgi:hypothetical protein
MFAGMNQTSLKFMKKTVLLLITWVALCTAAQAQMSIIPKAGVTFSNVVNKDDTEGQRAKTGFLVGVGLNLPIVEDFFSVQPELLYIQKGFGFDTEDFDIKFRETINYLEVPILAKIAFGGDIAKFHVSAGPSIGFGLGGNYKFSGDDADQIEDIVGSLDGDVTFGSDDDDSYNNRLDIGAQFGIGAGFKVGPGSLLLDLRYGLGLSNLLKEDADLGIDESDGKNRVIAISLGYAIPFGGK